MPTQNVNLTDQLNEFVKDQIAEGTYKNASEVHRAALVCLARQDEERKLKIQHLKAEAQKGLNEIASGNYDLINEEDELNEAMDSSLKRAMERLDNYDAEAI